MTGGVVSCTMTSRVCLAVLPAASVAENETEVIPSANWVPEAGVAITGTLPLMKSEAVALNVTTAPAALVASAVMVDGPVMTGGVRSTTLTVSMPVPVPPPLVAERPIEMVPSVLGREPEITPVEVLTLSPAGRPEAA